ncbi:hypothetical protein CROQUDRAFT_57956 [Cronartium quercuum f. sp. fusiforme G11]|uniref:Thioredoxin-like fold domain-containing protein n=1 Tax=Cronartium quercuum f. sp. fusiforme G11 TaxID=708437 RepID=A0A9P6TGA4_9BASI|nr:hypothetical protein CROQUDRAFT_57956 [Cronartium quercuum f. sp. fusiforme G11]
MTLGPQFIAHRLIKTGHLTKNSHTLEFFLDFTCPFSAKIFKSIHQHLIPIIEKNNHHHQISLIIRQVPQPWHHSSTFVHQAAIAVSTILLRDNPPEIASIKLWKYFGALFEHQAEYFDEPTLVELPISTKQRLAELASSTLQIDPARVLELVSLSGSGNAGTKIDPTLKLAVRYHRQNGIHVTPTVTLDGIIDPSISSSYTQPEWEKYIQEKLI